MRPDVESRSAATSDTYDMDGPWAKPPAMYEGKPTAAYEREEPCGDAQPHEAHLVRYGEYTYRCPGEPDRDAASTYDGQCSATTSDGKRCRKQARPGSQTCDTHQPERVLNRKMRRGLKHGGGLSSQLDHGVRQGG